MLLSAKHCCLAIAISLSLGALPALAQQTTAPYALNLPEQPLRDSLLALGKATHVNIVFDPAVVAGRRAPVLRGQYTPGEALRQLLAGSGLSAQQTPGGSYSVEPTPAPGNSPSGTRPASSSIAADASKTNTLDTVVVTAKVQGFSATRMPTALKDIPQSVSVIDRETLNQQNANDLSTAFNWATGVTMIQGSSVDSLFFSRGFQIKNFHIDGGGPMQIYSVTGQLTRLDLSQYESIELLRGADALFGGTGEPGGSINLARKRPLPESGVSLTASAGSWDRYRVEADINTGKITDDGRLRARLVAVNESEHYFYDTAQRRMNKLYAVAEYDLRPRTQLRAGGSVERTPDFVQFAVGLPRNADGSDPHLPRSTALTFPWLQNSSTSREGFLQLDHAFNDRWKLKAGVTRTEQDQTAAYVQPMAGINPVTRTIDFVQFGGGPLHNQQTTTDITLAGSFDWNGRPQELVFGADTKRQEATAAGSTLYGAPLDPFRLDTYPQPTHVAYSSLSRSSGREDGVFASVKIRPADGWALTAGARGTWSRIHTENQARFGSRQGRLNVGEASSSGMITPFFGAVYEINPTYSLYASYAGTNQGYGAGNLTRSGQVIPPARGTNMEAGLKAAWDEGRLNGSLALFDIRQINVSDFDPATPFPQPPHCCFLSTTQRSKGVEAELNGRLAPGWQLGAGYTLNINHAGDVRSLFATTPKHLFKLWTNYRLPGGAWDIGGGIVAQTEHFKMGVACTAFDMTTGRCTAYGPFRTQQGFYPVATLRVGYRVNERWNLALNVDNLFDRRYFQTINAPQFGNWYGAPRNWMLTLRGEF